MSETTEQETGPWWTREHTQEERIAAILRELKSHPKLDTPWVCGRAESLINDLVAQVATLTASLSRAEETEQRLTEEVRELRMAGGWLAAVVFNLAQKPNLAAYARDLNSTRVNWDAVIERHAASRATPPESGRPT